MLERLLRGKQVVLVEEGSASLCEPVEFPGVALPALIVIEGDLFDDTCVDKLLDVFVDSSVAHAGVEFLEFVHRGELLGMLEDVVDQREPRLLGNEVDELVGCRVVADTPTSVHNDVFNRA